MRDFKNLDVWGKAHQLTMSVYAASAQFPRAEIYGLRAQLRSAAVAVEANIAEGAGRRTMADFGRFLDISLGSTNEVETELLIARELGFLDAGTCGV